MQSIFFIATALIQFAVGNPVDTIGASQSPGAVSGNVVQVPIVLPVNACGNSVNVIGAVNPAFDNYQKYLDVKPNLKSEAFILFEPLKAI
ncbi:hypothetical protein CONCODRAFT_12375 [Conidiobolus coronatus NRRL 28638]|uniref:Chaplin domain-containing protein n=1 Tax=Conidiobolus coronatus (strain ATCC 28846 / CBS 209.66 / NRRL 28638) TaxID=796925 RepID=A0A137NTD4_CONC2|nr:hypothetical protein CONCODRAFT_12375 [Conidiobolus coronatus NRRL 28638]|eukprot:KXN65914.1 hypothetical protein CONCODRAFT_12375 [Conidiobolus coronatus NRRL 28638]